MGPEQSVSDSSLALWLVYPCAKWLSVPSLPCWLQHISFFFMNMFLCQLYSLSQSCFSPDCLCSCACCPLQMAMLQPSWPAEPHCPVTWVVCSRLLSLQASYTPLGWLSWFLFLTASVRLPAPKTRLHVAGTPRWVQHWPLFGDFATCQLFVSWCEANFILAEAKATSSVACAEGCSLFFTRNMSPPR